MKQIDIREGARRQHRVVALYAVLQCWCRQLDGLVIDRLHLERLLGLKRFKDTRMEWLRKDFMEYFRYVSLYKYTHADNSLGSLYVSMVDMEGILPSGGMKDDTRLAAIPAHGPKFGMFEIWPRPDKAETLQAFSASAPLFAEASNYDERILTSYFAMLTNGQTSLRQLFPPSPPARERSRRVIVRVPRQ